MELILDTSVIIKWFLPELLSEKALYYRRQHLDGEITIISPHLLAFEVTNVLCTKSGVKEEAVLSAIEAFYFTKVYEYPFTEKLAAKTAQYSKEYKISVYDAVYITLAQSRNCQFVTADEKLYEKVKTLKFVKLLSK